MSTTLIKLIRAHLSIYFVLQKEKPLIYFKLTPVSSFTLFFLSSSSLSLTSSEGVNLATCLVLELSTHFSTINEVSFQNVSKANQSNVDFPGSLKSEDFEYWFPCLISKPGDSVLIFKADLKSRLWMKMFCLRKNKENEHSYYQGSYENWISHTDFLSRRLIHAIDFQDIFNNV